MNRNHVCDICDTEADSRTEIPITEGWLNEDGYPSGRKTSLVICDDCFEKLREMIVEFKEPRTVTYYAGDKPVETVVLDEGEKTSKHIDFEPVRHGRWIFNPKDAIEMMFTLPKCSECGAESPNGGNHCPNCGAKMQGDNDGNK